MLARDAPRLQEISAENPHLLVPFVCDLSDPAALEACINAVKNKLGSPSVVVHNAVAAFFGDFMKVDPAIFRRNFEVNAVALLALAKATVPGMIAAGGGAIIATGNTSAYRGLVLDFRLAVARAHLTRSRCSRKPNFASFAPTKAAQRILMESIARQAGPQGVHAAYVAIDAVIDVPWTRDMTKKPQGDDFYSQPADIAGEVFHIAHQPKSTWVFDAVIRPFGETW
jgi:NAD(P)-dependent dehydrogenase (short-subunit alcohol dehydrogenase family)